MINGNTEKIKRKKRGERGGRGRKELKKLGNGAKKRKGRTTEENK
jgi:hypothetical protein